MGIVANTLRLVAVGSLPSGETWNTGYWTMPDAPITSYEQLLLDLAVVQAAFNTWTAGISGKWSGATQANELRAYYYAGSESGNEATFSAVVPLTANLGTGAPNLPDQCTVVASLRSGRSGRSFRGRMYVPVNKVTLDATGQLALNDALGIANQTKIMMDSVNASGLQVGVMSATQTAFTPVTSVQANTIVDTQRRRTNKIKPNGTSIQVLA